MPMVSKASLWACAIIATALLGAFGGIPGPVADRLVGILPMLAVMIMILPATAKSCSLLSRKEV